MKRPYLPYTCGPHKQERRNWPIWRLQSSSRNAHSVTDSSQHMILPNHSLSKCIFHLPTIQGQSFIVTPTRGKKKNTNMNQSIPLAFQQILHRDSRALRHDPRNIIRRDTIVQHRQRRPHVLLSRLAFYRELSLQVGDGGEAQSARDFVLALPLRHF
jgi:hypothetical protein